MEGHLHIRQAPTTYQRERIFVISFTHSLTHSLTNDLLENCQVASRSIQVKCIMKAMSPRSQAQDWYHCHFTSKNTKVQTDSNVGSHAPNLQVLLSLMVYSSRLSLSTQKMVQHIQIIPGLTSLRLKETETQSPLLSKKYNLMK